MIGFVYIWYDRKHKRYYVGSHWGTLDDGYVCSSTWMMQAYHRRPQDFKRRIIARVEDRSKLFDEEYRWLSMIKPHEIKSRYYNLKTTKDCHWHVDPERRMTVGQRISASNKGGKTSAGWKDPIARGKAISAGKKGKRFTDEHKAALSKAQFGTKQSEETRAKRAASIKRAWAEGRMTGTSGKKIKFKDPEERGKKISESLAGKPLSEEHRAKIAASGFGDHWKGKTRSEETKAKMAAARRAWWDAKRSS